MLYNIKIGVIKKMNDANKSEATKTEDCSEEPPPKSSSKEMLEDGSGGYCNNVLLKSYVLCRRNSLGQGRLALLSLHDWDNVSECYNARD